MKRRGAMLAALGAVVMVTAARGGHELPVYPSYYPHEIVVEAVSAERAAELLRAGKVQAHVGAGPQFSGDLPDGIAAVESLGAYVVVHVNPASPLAHDEPSACALSETVMRDLAGRAGGFTFHPYPVTPFHGDYLQYADLAEAARARFRDTPAPARDLKVRAIGGAAASLVRPEWQAGASEWDVAIETVDAGALVAAATFATNGWLGPQWVRSGWFQAHRVLADADGRSDRNRNADAILARLQAGDPAEMVERINLERELVRALAASCRRTVAGYLVKREYINTEFSAGIENIAFDATEGLASPIFIRTVKLKDFPWNGWLFLGMGARPVAAWNPIAGLTDPFGRLMWFALGDPAVIPSPYESTWMLNRVSDVQASPPR
jgi:hypothetical protein